MKFWLLTLLSVLLPSLVRGEQSEISSRMRSLADGLLTSYTAKYPSPDKRRIAVFAFDSGPELAKRRVGYAVAELLTHHIGGESGFVPVERLELNKILGELRLNLSGVTDPEDAVKAGRLGGG